MHIGSIYSSILCHVCGTDGVEPSFTSIRDLGYTKEKQAKAYSLSAPWSLLFQKTLLCIAQDGTRTRTSSTDPGFSYHYSFRYPFGLMVWTISSPCISVQVATIQSLRIPKYFYLVSTGLTFYSVSRLDSIHARSFLSRCSNCISPVRLPITPLTQKAEEFCACHSFTKGNRILIIPTEQNFSLFA